MRCFLALPIPADTALAIADWRQANWPTLTRPVNPANFHVTLAFLGDIDTQRQAKLASPLDEATEAQAGRLAAFDLLLDDTGYFPDSEVLWLGPRTTPDSAVQVAGACRRAAARAGIRTGKGRWQAHLTLARRVPPPLPAPLMPARFPVHFDHIVLYESILDRAGARYRPLMDWRLQTGESRPAK